MPTIIRTSASMYSEIEVEVYSFCTVRTIIELVILDSGICCLVPTENCQENGSERSNSVICVSESERALLKRDFAIQEIMELQAGKQCATFERVQGAFVLLVN